jgi:predicted ATPase/DNA-binding CsgD family transcriptional regulator
MREHIEVGARFIAPLQKDAIYRAPYWRPEPLWKVPTFLTPVVGREQDITGVCALLERQEVRLLTLFGTGGVGKTRLAVQVATEMREHFSDGVCFVLLAAINEPELVLLAIAETLDIQESADQSLFEQIAVVLQRKHLLMVLDNIEQVITIAPQVEELLAVCPSLKMVVTSREVLRVQSEHVFPVPPLALPDLKQLPPNEDLLHYTAIALFIQRVRAILPTFQLTPANARAIAEICVRLDGLPLAIELAAAHIRLLPPQALLTRLSQRLQLLKQSVRTLPARHQTLRSTLDWSYNLLSQDEQRLFQCLSVFVGGWSLEAVEAVWVGTRYIASSPIAPSTMTYGTHEPLSALEGVSSLLDKSLLLQNAQEGEEPYLLMLETVREYGLHLLAESGEAEKVRQAHALYYLTWAEKAAHHLRGRQQTLWQKRLEQEQENLRAALQWCIEHEETELACRFGATLSWFWHISGHWSEGLHWLEAALRLADAKPPTLMRAKALRGAGDMASCQGDYPAARTWIEESVTILRELHDTRELTLSLSMLSAIIADNDVATSRALAEESVALAREVGDSWNLAFALYLMGLAVAAPDNYTHANELLEQSVTLFRQLEDKRQLSLVLSQFGKMMASQGNMVRAETLCRESLSLARELGYKSVLLRPLYDLAKVLRQRGDMDQATTLLQESLILVRDLGDRCLLAMILHELAYIARDQQNMAQATTLLQESLILYQEMGETFLQAGALCDLGNLAQAQGDMLRATDMYKESLALSQQIGHQEALAWNLVGLAQIVRAKKQFQRAARLFAAAEAISPPHRDIEHIEWTNYERSLAEVRTQLDERTLAVAWAEGQTLTSEQALMLLIFHEEPVLVPVQPPSQPSVPVHGETSYPFGLTPREVEVLRLVSQGLTNIQVAEQLIVSPLTVNAHVRSIYNKLDVTTRSAATRLAIEHHLV